MTVSRHGQDYENQLREDYWLYEGTQKGVTEFLGAVGLGWSHMADINPVFLSVANRQKMRLPDKQSPATVIEPEAFPDTLQHFGGQVELHSSLWQKESADRPTYPRRTLLVWDVDLYDKANPTRKFENPEETFVQLEPVYQLMRRKLSDYGLEHMAVTTGAGYHFISQIPDTSPAMDELLKIVVVEPTVTAKQASLSSSSKRDRLVPPLTEAAHLAVARLQQFLFGQVIGHARQRSSRSVEISDKGVRGISFDNTAIVYSIHNRTIGVLGSPYFIKPEIYHPGFAGTILRIPRAGNGFELSLDETMRIRRSYQLASNHLKREECLIPDGSRGVGNLQNDYMTSGLRGLHEALDSTFGDAPERFNDTYRQYDRIIDTSSQTDRIRDLITNANDALLKPDNLDFFIWEVFKSWGGSRDKLAYAPHVAGLLRAIYEDPRFLWGEHWSKETDALRYARGWVSLVLGQAFENEA